MLVFLQGTKFNLGLKFRNKLSCLNYKSIRNILFKSINSQGADQSFMSDYSIPILKVRKQSHKETMTKGHTVCDRVQTQARPISHPGMRPTRHTHSLDEN